MPKKTRQCSLRGLEPGPLDPELKILSKKQQYLYQVVLSYLAYRLRLHRIKITATHASKMNKAAANAARIITTTLNFFGLSSSDVSSAISTWVVVEMETFPIEEKVVVGDEKVVVAVSVCVFRCTEEFLKLALFINGFKVGSISVTRGQQGKREIMFGNSQKTVFAGKS